MLGIDAFPILSLPMATRRPRALRGGRGPRPGRSMPGRWRGRSCPRSAASPISRRCSPTNGVTRSPSRPGAGVDQATRRAVLAALGTRRVVVLNTDCAHHLRGGAQGAVRRHLRTLRPDPARRRVRPPVRRLRPARRQAAAGEGRRGAERRRRAAEGSRHRDCGPRRTRPDHQRQRAAAVGNGRQRRRPYGLCRGAARSGARRVRCSRGRGVATWRSGFGRRAGTGCG